MSNAPSQAPPAARRGSPALRWIIGVTSAALIVTGALVVRHRLAPKHFEVVEAGVLYRSATLPAEQLVEVTDEYGIRTVVNLRSPEENAEPWYAAQRAALDQAGVDMVDLPMLRSTTPEPDVEARWLELIDDAAAQPILVHCQYGVLRTGIMVSVYDMLHRGADPEGLYERGPQFGHDVSADIRARIQQYLDGLDTRLDTDPVAGT